MIFYILLLIAALALLAFFLGATKGAVSVAFVSISVAGTLKTLAWALV